MTDGTKEHPMTSQTPSVTDALEPTVDAAWEAFTNDSRYAGSWEEAKAIIARHRPLIEAALSAPAPTVDARALASLHRVNDIYEEESPGGWTTKGWNRFVIAVLDHTLVHGRAIEAALSAPAPTVDAAALRDIVDRCRQHTAGIGFDIITIRAAITESDRFEALDRLRAHIHAVDDILTAALRASAPGDEPVMSRSVQRRLAVTNPAPTVDAAALDPLDVAHARGYREGYRTATDRGRIAGRLVLASIENSGIPHEGHNQACHDADAKVLGAALRASAPGDEG